MFYWVFLNMLERITTAVTVCLLEPLRVLRCQPPAQPARPRTLLQPWHFQIKNSPAEANTTLLSCSPVTLYTPPFSCTLKRVIKHMLFSSAIIPLWL